MTLRIKVGKLLIKEIPVNKNLNIELNISVLKEHLCVKQSRSRSKQSRSRSNLKSSLSVSEKNPNLTYLEVTSLLTQPK